MIRITSDNVLYDKSLRNKVEAAYNTLLSKTGAGNEFLGWMNPQEIAPNDLLNDIQATANRLIQISDYVVIAGIGGSYLGSKAVIEALQQHFTDKKPKIIYAGHHLSEDYYADLLRLLDTVDYSIIVISKSGTTTETAEAFRLLEKHSEKKYGKKENKNRIVCITDKEKGALKTLADKKHYKTFVIPDNVGGRFSVLTPVGLLPIALAGFNIRQLIEGAEKMSKQLLQSVENNPAVEYAYYRNYFLKNKLKIEIMATFEPKLFYLIEWWKQLFGESEGKENKGIFPSGLIYTTDLHSMGQYLQQGERMLFETFLSVKNANQKCVVPNDKDNLDKLNYLVGKRISEINRQAELGTIIAHQDGNVPTILIEIDKLNEANLGALIYFFEFACGVSAYTLEVNPFNQPGVEMYKNNMFALLKKEGYEKEHIILQKRLSKKE